MTENVFPKTRYESPLVKICGITNVDDALHAAACGAEFLGFNFFHGSPRYIKPADAKEIIKRLPQSTVAVGVFVNEREERILEICEMTGLKVVQLHGDESPGFVARLREVRDVEVIKAVRIRPGDRAEDLVQTGANAILLDGYSKRGWGGLGERIDWQLAYEVGLLHGPIFLAGGLNPESIEEAIRTVRPHGVDAASGVESSPGKKDPMKVEEFIRNAKGV
ncbi:MAG TPA: phosphoribosylanthranilate isomerase [Pyrinomonadaceae bacterium]|nr:phosphoribosylanthranilate isomerase [Pyrinomonadaceae bacterium]